jgi:hypothetical protein
MKHTCCVNGCGNRGIWYRCPYQLYCRVHRQFAASNGPLYGWDHDGRKVGKPRAWAETRRDKENGWHDLRKPQEDVIKEAAQEDALSAAKEASHA